MSDTTREFEQLMLKNKERGLLSKSSLYSLKKLGIDLFDNTQKSDERQKKTKTGQLQIENKMLQYQRVNGAYLDSSWKPVSMIYHTDEFYHFINSMTDGFFPDKLYYEPFERYKAQAQYWYENSKNPYDAKTFEERKEIILEEYARIDSNTLYFSMKYGMFIDGTRREGKARYVPKEHNAVIFFLCDCGYSFMFGKPRQIFASTTIGMYIIKKLLVQENFFMKFITMDVETGMEILTDKIKPVFALLPHWLRPQAARDYNKGLRVGRKISKGEYATPNSRVEVVAPSKTAINGGAPSVVFVDEIGGVPDLIPMVLEARPTMYIDVNQDGNLQMVRQLIMFGTGVSDNRGKDAFSHIWESTLELWNKKEYKSAIFVPLFFSWHTRCGEQVYEQEKKTYYAGNIDDIKEYSAEERKSIFHMHYPSHWRDMFGAATNKLVSREFIETNLSRIRNIPALDKPIYGHFIPIYDYTKLYDDTYLPITHKITGAQFIPLDDDRIDRELVSCQLCKFPDSKWKDRFFKGVDPISTETGGSKFASVVWDAWEKLPACVMNFRKSHDHKAAFLQSLLMALYYDPAPTGQKRGILELVENNIGTNYKDFCESLGYGTNLVFNKELPKEMHGGGALWGFNSKTGRKELAVASLSECVLNYGNKFPYEIIFQQLHTYVPKQNSTGTSWQPSDKRLYNDDVLDALAYAYICRKAFAHREPQLLNDNARDTTIKYRYSHHRLPDGTLTRIREKIIE